jgi:hypothetical protein
VQKTLETFPTVTVEMGAFPALVLEFSTAQVHAIAPITSGLRLFYSTITLEITPQGEIDAFYKSGVEGARKAERLETVREVRQFAQAHAALDPSEPAAAIGLFDLTVQQVERDLPTRFARDDIGDPLTEMGGDGIEVEVKAVAGKDWQTAWSQGQCHRVQQRIGHVLGAWTQLKCWDQFGGRLKGDPHPEVVGLVAQGGEEFIQLEMAEGQVLKKVGVHFLGMLTGAGQPEANRHFGVTEEQLSIGEGQSEIDGEEDEGDVGRRGTETIQGGAAATGKTFAAGLTPQPLNAIRAAFALPHQGMDHWVSVAEVVALGPWTGVPGRADGLGLTAGALAFRPGQHPRFPDVADEWRRMRASTHGAILGRAGLQWTRRFVLGCWNGYDDRPMSRAPEASRAQNGHPQHAEPRQILVEHLAPQV